MRAYFEQVIKDNNITSEVMFGKRDAMPISDIMLEQLAAGVDLKRNKQSILFIIQQVQSTKH